MKQHLSFRKLSPFFSTLSLGVLTLSLVFATGNARADETATTTTKTHKHHKKTVLAPTPQVSDSVSSASAADTYLGSSDYGSSKFGLGFATASKITGSSTALTGLINLSPTTMIQPLFSLDHTAGAMQLTAGGIFKYTVVKKGSSGLHLGGSLGLGWLAPTGSTTNEFAFDLGALVGFHFALPGTSDAIMLHLDGGAVFTHVNAPNGASATNDFAIDSISPAVGLSIFYML